VLCAFVFAACSGIGSGGSDDNNDNSNNDPPPTVDANDDKLYEEYADVYYNENNSYSEEFIVLTEDKIWYDNTGMTGKYKLEEERTTSGYLYVNLRLYEDLTDNNVVYQNWRFSGSDSSMMYIDLDDGSRLFFEKSMDPTPVPECPKSLEYELSEDGEYYIIVGIGEAAGDIVVPKRYRLTPVKEIADRAFYNNRALVGVEVPDTVTIIGEHAFAKCANLTSAKIQAQITELTEEFFGGCTKLVDVHIPKTVTEINYRAFKDCEKVQNVYYGGDASEWANIKFGISASHASGNLGSEEPYWANPISGDGRRLIINDSTVTSCELGDVSNGAFFQYKYLTSVKASYVGNYAFYNSSITSLSANTIGMSACEGCHNLKSFSGGGTAIGNKAFSDCTAMTAAFLGKSVVAIGEYAFSFCDRLTAMKIPSSVVTIGKYAFSGNIMEEITFENVTDWQIESNGKQQAISQDLTNKAVAAKLLTQGQSNYGYAEYTWSIIPLVYSLNSDKNSYTVKMNVTFDEEVWEIPKSYMDKPVTGIDKIFSPNLIVVYIPNSITTIKKNAFSQCDRLTIYCELASELRGWDKDWNSLNFPVIWNHKNNNVANNGYIYTEIGGIRYRLKDGEAAIIAQLKEVGENVNIPSTVMYNEELYNVTDIFASAFLSCNLTQITIPNSVTNIGYGAFRGCNRLESITFPLIREFKTMFGGSVPRSLNNVIINGGNRGNISSMEFADCFSLTSVTIGNGVTSIGSYAFSGCSSLTSIIILDSLTSIGMCAFDCCSSLTSIIIPDSLTRIGTCAFSDCSSLTSITIPNSVTSIGEYAFSDCSSLMSITIPNSVTSIGSCAFYGCSSLTSITIPDSLTSIGVDVFYGCSSLTIYCEATSKPNEWDTIWNVRWNNRGENFYNPVVWGYKNT